MDACKFNPQAFPARDDLGIANEGMTQFEWFYGQALAGGQSPNEAREYAKQALMDCASTDQAFQQERSQI